MTQQLQDTEELAGICAANLAALGKMYAKEGRAEEMREVLFLADRLGSPEVSVELGNLLAGEGKIDEALAQYGKALALDPGDCGALIGAGVASLLKNDSESAVSFFVRVLRANELNARALCGMAMAEASRGGNEEAFHCLKIALEIDPENLTALHELVKCAYILGRFAEAEQYLETYLLYHPGDLDMHFSLAGIRFKAGKYAEALGDLEKVLLLAPGYEGGEELHARIREKLRA